MDSSHQHRVILADIDDYFKQLFIDSEMVGSAYIREPEPKAPEI